MDERPSEPELKKLLEQLNDQNGHKRIVAAESVQRQRLTDPDIVNRLQWLASNDPLRVVRDTARSTLIQLGIAPPAGEELKPEAPPLSRNKKIRNLLIGFAGWYIANGLFWYSQFGGSTNTNTNGEYIIANLILFPINLLVLIILSAIKSTRWVGLGILVALALNLLLALIVGTSINGWCFIPFYVK